MKGRGGGGWESSHANCSDFSSPFSTPPPPPSPPHDSCVRKQGFTSCFFTHVSQPVKNWWNVFAKLCSLKGTPNKKNGGIGPE